MWKYYVYELIDPRNGLPFYVGKGTGNRYKSHEKEAKHDIRSRKCDLIRDIKNCGKTIQYNFLAFFLKEQDAYDFETECISEIGLVNLTNVLPGGQKAWIERESVLKEKKRIRTLKHPAMIRMIAIWLKRRAQWGDKYPNPHRIWTAAIWDATCERFPSLWEEIQKAWDFDELKSAMKVHDVTLLRTGQ